MSLLLPGSHKGDVGVLFLLHPREIARQLTYLDFENLKKIKPRECVRQAWVGEHREEKAPNIVNMVNHFNKLSRWVSTAILREKLSDRVRLIVFFIRVMHECLSLNNFNACYAIFCGTYSTPIFRLKRTWATLKQKFVALFEGYRLLFSLDNNMKNIREELRRATPPCIPHLGVFLGDLTFVDSGNPSKVGGLINFVKFRRIVGIVEKLHSYQRTKYVICPCESLQAFFRDLNPMTENELYAKSKMVEPKL